MQTNDSGKWYRLLPLAQMFRIMKLLAAIMLIVVMQVSATGFSQKVTLNLQDVTLLKVFKEIRKQTGFNFFYKSQMLKQVGKVSVKVSDADVNEVLKQCLANQPIGFSIENETIILTEKKAVVNQPVKTEEKMELPLPDFEVSGVVSDDKGDPLPGASVKLKGTDRGTSTNEAGRFIISVPNEGGTLTISYVGYETSEVAVRRAGQYNVSMKVRIDAGEELIVVGYGIQRRKSVTGAISRVSSEDVKALTVTDPRQALQGRVPGLTVVNNGSPGESPIIRIRGIGSINYASDPFYVVDGFPGGDMSMIDSRDIESIEVLRDASSAAIYGSRAANGVVIVTTKKGRRSSKLNVNVDSYYGIQTRWNKLDLLNTDQYIQYATALKQNAGSALPARFTNLDAPVYQGATQTYRQTNTNWQDEMFRTSPITQTNISLLSGNDKSRMYTSAGFVKQEGIMIGTDYQRFNLRFNSDHNLSDRVTLGHTLAIATEEKTNENNAGGRTQLKHIIHNVPYIPVKDPTLPGGYRGPSGDDGSDPQNPVRVALQDISRNNTFKLLGSGFVEVKIIKGLKYKFTAGANYSNFINRENLPIYNESFNARTINNVRQTQATYRSIYLSNQLTYEKSIGKHNFNVTAIGEKQDGRNRFLFGGGGYTTNELQQVTSSLRDAGVNGGLAEDILYSYIGRLNYEYDGKYLLSGSVRRDGSSVFAPGNKWANFPSVSAGWRVSEEEFLRNSNIISELKLRGSWGKMGFNGIGNYAWQAVLLQNTAPVLGGDRQPGAYFNALGNSDLKWEITTMTNFGVDLGFLRNKLSVSAEYYIRKTEGLILQTPLAPSLGFSSSTPANVGSMENKGFELMATYVKTSGSFTWDVSANISTVKNKVLSFGENIKSPIFAGSNADFGGFDITRTQVGQTVQSFYGWQVESIFQNQGEIDAANLKDGDATTLYQANAKPGDIKFRDNNNDGVINADDRVVLGSFIPKLTYGANFTGKYKNFDFTLFLQGVQGNKIYNGTKVLTQGMLRLFGAGVEVLDAWTPTNTNTDIPRAVDGDPNNNSRTSDRFLEDGSYLRVKILSVGYRIPQGTLARIAKGSISSFRFYISGQNLLTLTKYTGYDPEVGSRFASALTSGIDYGQFPQARTILAGVQIGF